MSTTKAFEAAAVYADAMACRDAPACEEYDWRVRVMAVLMEQVTRDLAALPDAPTVFDAASPVAVDLMYYLQRWLRKTGADGALLIVGLCIMDRYLERSGMSLTRYNRHRLLLTSLAIASKVTDDYRYANTVYASVGGVSLTEINRMERAFLTGVDWDVNVGASEFKTYADLFATFFRKQIAPVRAPRTRSPSVDGVAAPATTLRVRVPEATRAAAAAAAAAYAKAKTKARNVCVPVPVIVRGPVTRKRAGAVMVR